MAMVEVVESSMVAPSAEAPRHKLWLTDLDNLPLWDHFGTIYCYKHETYNGDSKNFFSPEVLRESLSKALLLFYPLAGRLVVGEDGRREIDCTGEGSLFVVARSEYTLDELAESEPSETIKRALIPAADSNSPITMFQVTFLKCGSVCLGIAMHHASADGAAALRFIKTWCDIARGVAVDTITPPFMDRTVLRGREPEISSHSPIALGPCVTVEIKLSKFHVDKLKKLAVDGSDTKRVSTFKAVAAHIWLCACRARGLSGNVETLMHTLMDFRQRLLPPLPNEFLGNALAVVSIDANVDELLSSQLPYAVERIGKTLAEAKFAPAEKKSSFELKFMEKREIWVTSWLAMPMYELDFGYGNPTFMMRLGQSSAGNFFLANDGNGGVTIIASFEPEAMPLLKKMIYEGLEVQTENSVQFM